MFKASLLIAFLMSSPLFASDRVKLDVSAKEDKDLITVNFKVTIKDALKVNMDAPWKLTLEDKSSSFEKLLFNKADFNKELPGFVVVSKKLAKKKPQSLSYKLNAYSCNKDASQCFHDLIQGTYEFKTKN